MSPHHRIATTLALVLVPPAIVGGLAAPARASACTGSSGVSVVVDFGKLGGRTTGCASGNPSTGLAALQATGHGYTFVPRQPGFVCTIDDAPTPCNGAPTTAYWSYWHASPGGSWTYSSRGTGSYDPAPGTVEGWAFGAGSPPGTPPPGAAAPRPTSRTTTDRPTSPPASTSPASTSPASTSPTSMNPGRTPTPTTSSGPPPSASPSASAGTGTTSASPTSDRPTPVAAVTDAPPGAGGAGGLAAAAVAVLLLAGGAVTIAWRRRQID